MPSTRARLEHATDRVVDGWIDVFRLEPGYPLRTQVLATILMVPLLLVLTPIVFAKAAIWERPI